MAQETSGLSEPSFWLRHTHVKMRESVEGLVSEMQRLSPSQLGNLPAITEDLLHMLDDLIKLIKAGAGQKGTKSVTPGYTVATRYKNVY